MRQSSRLAQTRRKNPRNFTASNFILLNPPPPSHFTLPHNITQDVISRSRSTIGDVRTRSGHPKRRYVHLLPYHHQHASIIASTTAANIPLYLQANNGNLQKPASDPAPPLPLLLQLLHPPKLPQNPTSPASPSANNPQSRRPTRRN